MKRGTGRDGFTLIELVVVIALLALVVAIVAPAAGRLIGASSGKEDADRLAQALRAARTAAIAEARPQRFRIHAERRQWQYGGASGTVDAATVTVAVPPVGEGDNGVRTIVFLPDGSATGGRIDIGSGTSRRSVQIDWLTGHVEIVAP